MFIILKKKFELFSSVLDKFWYLSKRVWSLIKHYKSPQVTYQIVEIVFLFFFRFIFKYHIIEIVGANRLLGSNGIGMIMYLPAVCKITITVRDIDLMNVVNFSFLFLLITLVRFCEMPTDYLQNPKICIKRWLQSYL